MFDWNAVFGLDENPLELIVRASIIYLLLIVALRMLGRRELGSLQIPDLLFVLLIADGVQNGMGGAYTTVPGALVVGGTLVAWNYAIMQLIHRFERLRRLLHPPPLPLIADGTMLRANMRKELVTTDELEQMLRIQGIEDIAEIKSAYLESDGELSVIRHTKGEEQKPNRKRKAVA